MDRALQGQFSVTLALTIYAVYLASTVLARKTNIRFLPAVICPLFMVFLSANYINKDRVHITHYQCHFGVNIWNKLLTDGINENIPKGSSVAFSDESFYFYYLCRKAGYNVTKCPRGNEQYLIKLRGEPFFMGSENDFVLKAPVGDYGVYINVPFGKNSR